MRIVIVIAVLCCVGFLTRMSFATAFGKDCERDSLSLNGKWEVFRGRGDEEMWKPGQAAEAILPVQDFNTGSLEQGFEF